MLIRLLLPAAVFCFLFHPAAEAQSLKERKFRTEQEEALKAEVKTLNDTCGTSVTVAFDWGTKKLEELEQYSVPAFCDHALNALEQICGDAEGKKAVQEKVKKVSCVLEGPRNAKLENGTLTYSIDFRAANNEEYVHEYLMNSL